MVRLMGREIRYILHVESILILGVRC